MRDLPNMGLAKDTRENDDANYEGIQVHCSRSGIFGMRTKGGEAGVPPAVNGN
jgi:hypothetical protein